MSTDAPARQIDSRSVWERTVLGWHLTFAAGLVVVAIVLVSDSDVGAQRWFALAAVALLALAYVVLGLPAVNHEPSWRASSYLVVLVAVTGALVVLGGTGMTLILFVAFPQIWFFSATFRAGALWSATLTLVVALAILREVGVSGPAVRDVVLSMSVALVVSLLLGLWVGQVIQQSTQRAELIRELERARADLGQAEHAAGVLAERERLAGEIHDTLAQGFTSIIALAQAERARLASVGDPAPRLGVLEETGRDNLAEARALVAAFAPVDLDGADIEQALRRLASRFTTETGVPVQVETGGGRTAGWNGTAGAPAPVSTAQAVVLLRVSQEALANVRRHSGAAAVVLRLTTDPTPSLEVVDDGVGFASSDQVDGFGLDGMRRRVEASGGRLWVDSSPGQGTRVRVSLP